MLYTSTRNKHASYTAQRAITYNRTDDGGLFVPVQIPQYDQDRIVSFAKQPSNEVIAAVLNDLLGSVITERDVDFVLGKRCFAYRQINHRIVVGELWRNPEGDFSRTVRALSEHLRSDKSSDRPVLWMQVAAEVAVLFALCTRIMSDSQFSDVPEWDAVVPTGDFTDPTAVWLTRKMGLPIKNIICCCNYNGAAWDLLQRGQVKADMPIIHTTTPQCDSVIPSGIEWLIYEVLGADAVNYFLHCCQEHGMYEMLPEEHEKLRQGMYASVVSEDRLFNIIPNVYSATGYVLCPYSALSYSGLMDYRSITGENRSALLFSFNSPIKSEDAVARAMDISKLELNNRVYKM